MKLLIILIINYLICKNINNIKFRQNIDGKLNKNNSYNINKAMLKIDLNHSRIWNKNNFNTNKINVNKWNRKYKFINFNAKFKDSISIPGSDNIIKKTKKKYTFLNNNINLNRFLNLNETGPSQSVKSAIIKPTDVSVIKDDKQKINSVIGTSKNWEQSDKTSNTHDISSTIGKSGEKNDSTKINSIVDKSKQSIVKKEVSVQSKDGSNNSGDIKKEENSIHNQTINPLSQNSLESNSKQDININKESQTSVSKTSISQNNELKSDKKSVSFKPTDNLKISNATTVADSKDHSANISTNIQPISNVSTNISGINLPSHYNELPKSISEFPNLKNKQPEITSDNSHLNDKIFNSINEHINNEVIKNSITYSDANTINKKINDQSGKITTSISGVNHNINGQSVTNTTANNDSNTISTKINDQSGKITTSNNGTIKINSKTNDQPVTNTTTNGNYKIKEIHHPVKNVNEINTPNNSNNINLKSENFTLNLKINYLDNLKFKASNTLYNEVFNFFKSVFKNIDLFKENFINVFMENSDSFNYKAIGKGGFGYVFEIESSYQKEFVIKCNIRNDKNELFEKEIKNHETFTNFDDHSFINIYGVILINSSKYKNICIIIERLNGDLTDKSLADYNQSHILEIYTKLKTSIKILHNHGYYHRDIKPENIFYKIIFDNQDYEIKLGDYGLVWNNNNKEKGKITIAGTPNYMKYGVNLTNKTINGVENEFKTFKDEDLDVNKLMQNDLYALARSLYLLYFKPSEFNVFNDKFINDKLVSWENSKNKEKLLMEIISSLNKGKWMEI